MRFKSVAEFLDPTQGHHPTNAERDLIEAVQEGRDCWRCDRENPTRPATATADTRVRADLLRLLITGGSKDCGLHESGVTLYGGWIEGPLDLAYCTALGRTALHFCRFPEKPRLEQANFHLLSLQDSQLDLGLFAQSMRVKGSLFLNRLIATGTVDVNATQIGGQLSCSGAVLDGNGSRALNGQGATITQSLFLTSVVATGTIDVAVGQIGRQFDCSDAVLKGGKDQKGKQQPALHAQGVRIGENLLLRNFAAMGTVAVNGASIDGQLDCTRAALDGNGGEALDAHRLRVTQGFFFRNLRRVTGGIDLTAAHVGDLVDDPACWPKSDNDLILDGFTYERIVGPITFGAREKWLRAGSHWQGEFFPQPYTQLARVLRQMGHAGEARKVLIERERLLAHHRLIADSAEYQAALHDDPMERGDAGWIWLRMRGLQVWNWLTRIVAGYGYAPQRALYFALGIVPLFALLYFVFWRLGAMVPAEAILLVSPEWAEAVAANPSAPSHVWQGPAQKHYETFYSLPYALDVFLPIVDLGQQSTWSQTTETWAGWGARLTTWVLQSLGYVVTSLGLAAATGIIQRNQPD